MVTTLVQGDDFEFVVNITTDVELTNKKMRFQLNNIKKDFNDITSKTLTIVLSKEETMSLQVGLNHGFFKLFDNQGTEPIDDDKAVTLCKDGTPVSITFQVISKKVDNV